MKKRFYPCILTILLLALFLGACSTKTSSSSSAGASGQELSQVEQLLVGTLKLEGTSNAVDAKQAGELLPLWQAYRQLTNSDTAAQAEIKAVIAQIQGTMTKDQIQAITAMKLTRQDMFTTMSSLGLGNFQPGAQGTPGFSSTPRAQFFSGEGGGFAGGAGGPPSGGGQAGGGPGGGPVVIGPGGGGDFGGGFPGGGTGGANATLSATQLAARAANADRVSPVLLNALIDLLQKKAQS